MAFVHDAMSWSEKTMGTLAVFRGFGKLDARWALDCRTHNENVDSKHTRMNAWVSIRKAYSMWDPFQNEGTTQTHDMGFDMQALSHIR